ncbi:MAG: ATP-binding cassette, subfamily er 3 [Kosmotogales bacterium]|nr:ATP-binding cassette, subfamily er 3 [Kosmotogales bacterium]
MLLTMEKIGHDYGNGFLFENVSSSLYKKDKIVLIGKNGSGKTTLLKILSGKLEQSEGSLYVSSNLKIGYQTQERIKNMDQKLFDYYMESINLVLKDTEEYYSFERRVRSILTGLEFPEKTWERKISSFSGGEITRISLGKLLLVDYDLLILDEPTNHLDIESVQWLLNFIKNYNGAVILVTHDRYLLRKVGNRFWELNSGSLWDFKGDFELYRKEREVLLKSGLRQRANMEKEIDRLTAIAKRYRIWGEDKFIKQAKSKERQAEKLKTQMNEINLPDEEIKEQKISIPEPSRTGYVVLSIEDLSYNYGDKKIFKKVHLELNRREKLSILGINGSGKTTLLNLITDNIPRKTGEIQWGYNVKWKYLSQLKEDLNRDNDVLKEIWKIKPYWPDFEIRKYIGRFGFTGDDVFKNVGELSGGEKTRLALSKVILQAPNVLIMDEPTNNLDIWTIESLEKVLKEFKGAIILVSHDRDFVENICDKYVLIENQKLKKIGSLDYYLKHIFDNNETKKEESESKISYKERKKMQNRYKSIIRKIEELTESSTELEMELEILNKKMFTFGSDYEKIEQFNKTKKEKEEKVIFQLEEIENLKQEKIVIESSLDD